MVVHHIHPGKHLLADSLMTTALPPGDSESLLSPSFSEALPAVVGNSQSGFFMERIGSHQGHSRSSRSPSPGHYGHLGGEFLLDGGGGQPSRHLLAVQQQHQQQQEWLPSGPIVQAHLSPMTNELKERAARRGRSWGSLEDSWRVKNAFASWRSLVHIKVALVPEIAAPVTPTIEPEVLWELHRTIAEKDALIEKQYLLIMDLERRVEQMTRQAQERLRRTVWLSAEWTAQSGARSIAMSTMASAFNALRMHAQERRKSREHRLRAMEWGLVSLASSQDSVLCSYVLSAWKMAASHGRLSTSMSLLEAQHATKLDEVLASVEEAWAKVAHSDELHRNAELKRQEVQQEYEEAMRTNRLQAVQRVAMTLSANVPRSLLSTVLHAWVKAVSDAHRARASDLQAHLYDQQRLVEAMRQKKLAMAARFFGNSESSLRSLCWGGWRRLAVERSRQRRRLELDEKRWREQLSKHALKMAFTRWATEVRAHRRVKERAAAALAANVPRSLLATVLHSWSKVISELNRSKVAELNEQLRLGKQAIDDLRSSSRKQKLSVMARFASGTDSALQGMVLASWRNYLAEQRRLAEQLASGLDQALAEKDMQLKRQSEHIAELEEQVDRLMRQWKDRLRRNAWMSAEWLMQSSAKSGNQFAMMLAFNAYKTYVRDRRGLQQLRQAAWRSADWIMQSGGLATTQLTLSVVFDAFKRHLKERRHLRAHRLQLLHWALSSLSASQDPMLRMFAFSGWRTAVSNRRLSGQMSNMEARHNAELQEKLSRCRELQSLVEQEREEWLLHHQQLREHHDDALRAHQLNAQRRVAMALSTNVPRSLKAAVLRSWAKVIVDKHRHRSSQMLKSNHACRRLAGVTRATAFGAWAKLARCRRMERWLEQERGEWEKQHAEQRAAHDGALRASHIEAQRRVAIALSANVPRALLANVLRAWAKVLTDRHRYIAAELSEQLRERQRSMQRIKACGRDRMLSLVARLWAHTDRWLAGVAFGVWRKCAAESQRRTRGGGQLPVSYSILHPPVRMPSLWEEHMQRSHFESWRSALSMPTSVAVAPPPAYATGGALRTVCVQPSLNRAAFSAAAPVVSAPMPVATAEVAQAPTVRLSAQPPPYITAPASAVLSQSFDRLPNTGPVIQEPTAVGSRASVPVGAASNQPPPMITSACSNSAPSGSSSCRSPRQTIRWETSPPKFTSAVGLAGRLSSSPAVISTKEPEALSPSTDRGPLVMPQQGRSTPQFSDRVMMEMAARNRESTDSYLDELGTEHDGFISRGDLLQASLGTQPQSYRGRDLRSQPPPPPRQQMRQLQGMPLQLAHEEVMLQDPGNVAFQSRQLDWTFDGVRQT